MSDSDASPKISERLKAQLPAAQTWINDTVGKSDARLLELLDERKTGFENSLRGISEAQAKFTPGDDQWCIDEVCRHLAHSNSRVAGLIEALTSGYVPGGSPVMGYVPSDERSFDAVRADFLNSFELLRAAFRTVADPGANLEVKYTHPFFGALNAREWFVFNFVHASAHLQQVERIKASAGFPAG